MYVDAAKTLIAGSGIAVTLLASSAVSGRATNEFVAASAKVAVVCLISCVCLSLVVILALMRGFERAQSRHMESGGAPGPRAKILPLDGTEPIAFTEVAILI
jgi:hypothetical protein